MGSIYGFFNSRSSGLSEVVDNIVLLLLLVWCCCSSWVMEIPPPPPFPLAVRLVPCAVVVIGKSRDRNPPGAQYGGKHKY